jgi:signal transduction histidine kinase
VNTRAHDPVQARRFHRRLLVALTLLVVAITAASLHFARRTITRDAERGMEREFTAALDAHARLREARALALAERCRLLVRKARIHAALEDGALDLLYPSARDELRDVLAANTRGGFGAHFYRFLDRDGRIIPPDDDDAAAGPLAQEIERSLTTDRVPDSQQAGIVAPSTDEDAWSEVVVTPIVSYETGETIAALAIGFPLLHDTSTGEAVATGVWTAGRLHLPGLDPDQVEPLRTRLAREPTSPTTPDARVRFELHSAGEPLLVFHQPLDTGSAFPPAHEIAVFSLAEVDARRRRALAQIGLGGVVLIVGGLLVGNHLARRFTVPVAQLEQDTHEQRAARREAEAALESTHAELERAARFSADASHQLKTPVTVLRAGLEEMLARGALPSDEAEEVSMLVHQTYRLSSLIEDLLLLSRLDAGQLRVHFAPVDLALLVEASLDDLGAVPDELDLESENGCPADLFVSGERRYIALILQNLLENARKYNRPGGRVRIAAVREGESVRVTIGNTTRRPIPAASRAHLFERFHRAGAGEDVPGYGIGLNLSRELARLHEGDLRLVRSEADWTEFELRLRASADMGRIPPAT